MGALDKIKNLFTINYEDFDDDLYGDEYYDDVEDTKAIKKAAKAKKSKYDDYEDDEVYTKPSRSFRSSKKVVPMTQTRTAFTGKSSVLFSYINTSFKIVKFRLFQGIFQHPPVLLEKIFLCILQFSKSWHAFR